MKETVDNIREDDEIYGMDIDTQGFDELPFDNSYVPEDCQRDYSNNRGYDYRKG